MDTTRRTVAKAVSWQLLGLVVMTGLGAAFTGSAAAGGALALSSAAVGVLGYILHEKLWARIGWGRRAGK